jgi:uncharacterized OsmC-like protein
MDLMTVSWKDGLEVDVRVRGHVVTSDMSPQDGGLDAGLSPAELLAASLGACIAMMVQRYCDRHGYEGETVVYLAPELADDPKRVGSIAIDVEAPSGVPEDKKDAVRRVAERCLVHETLRHPPKVDIDIM